MMPSPSKANRRKPKKRKQPRRNWLELPENVTANILYRVGVFDILENAQKVCTAWRKICKDPAMWRVIYVNAEHLNLDDDEVRAMCKHAVDRSQGQLIDITMVNICDDELLLYIAERSSQLKHLKIEYSYDDIDESWTEALMKFSSLEELSLYKTTFSKEAIETASRHCPLLKTLKVIQEECSFGSDGDTDEESIMFQNEMAIAIGENLHELEHLELIGDSMSNIGLQAILDGCRHLKSLDLRHCLYLDLKGDLGKKCSQQIKCLKLPDDSLKDRPHIYESQMRNLFNMLG